MARKVQTDRGSRLEGLCEVVSDDAISGDARACNGRVRYGPGAPGIERLEAQFSSQAFSPHRHDTYAIGITLSGVQRFRYRGTTRYCLPGECHVLHPDEVHDGAAATADGFAYRIVYIDPGLIRDARGGGDLPFVKSAVIDPLSLPGGTPWGVWEIERDIDEISRVEIAIQLADLLVAASSDPTGGPGTLAEAAVSRVRDLIAVDPARRYAMRELEHASGLDRWTLARQFRTMFGTSPSRFRTLRQLDLVRRQIRAGSPLAQASTEAGFADQSHMSRHFKAAYGFTPAVWATLISR
jgi:AraC-like DNA-binding protein